MKTIVVPLEQLVSVTQLQKDYKSLINRVKQTKKEIYITCYGRPEIIMTSLERFESLKRKAEQAEVKNTLRIVSRGRKEFKKRKAKRLTSLKQLK